MEHLFYFELAGGLEVGAAASPLGEDGASLIGEQAHCLRAARIDAEDMHLTICYNRTCLLSSLPHAQCCNARWRSEPFQLPSSKSATPLGHCGAKRSAR